MSRTAPPLLSVIAALSLAACSAANARDQAGTVFTDAPPIRVSSVTARAVEAPRLLALQGTLGPRRAARLAPLVSGHVARVHVELGDAVALGAPLVSLRATDLGLAARAAEARADALMRQLGADETRGVAIDDVASVRAAKAELDNASDLLGRMAELRQRGAVDERSHEEALRQRAAAEARFENARQAAAGQLASLAALRAEAGQRRNDASNAVVRAPFAGRVAKKLAELGEFVGPQNAVVELVDTAELVLTLEVPERDVSRVHAGQTVEVSIDGCELTRTGVVTHLSAALDASSRSLTVEVSIPNDDGALRPGHFARARLLLDGAERVIAVPKSALRERAGVQRVFVVTGGRAEARLVEVVETRGAEALVQGELVEGEAVVASPPRELADGSKVQG
jgi:HlyD family secretion protein